MRLFKRLVQASGCEGLIFAHWWVDMSFVPLVGRAVSGGVVSGQLCAQEDIKQSVCWWVRLYSYHFDYLAWGFPALVPTGFWAGTSLGEKMAAFQRARANENSPELPLPVSLSLQWATAITPTSTTDPAILAGKSGPVDYEVFAFFLGAGAYETLCVPANSGIFVSPSFVEFLLSNPTGLESYIL